MEPLTDLLERLKKRDRALAVDIQLVTAWIKDHLDSRPAYNSSEYRSWRRASCRLHQKRSDLKTKREETQLHLRVIAQKIEGIETGFPKFPIFWDQDLEMELVPADA